MTSQSIETLARVLDNALNATEDDAPNVTDALYAIARNIDRLAIAVEDMVVAVANK